MSVYSLTSPARAEGLDDLFAAALASDPSIAATSARDDAADADVALARAAVLPTLSATGGYTRNQVEASFAIPGTEDVVVVQKQDQLDAVVRAEVPLVDVAAWSGLGAADACRDAASIRAAADREDALLAVATAAWAVRTAEHAVEARERQSEADRRLVEEAVDREALGTATSLDVLTARAELARAEQEHHAATADLRDARRRLAARTSLGDVSLELAPRPFDAPDRAASLEQRAAELDVACQERRRGQERWRHAPTVTAFAQEQLTNATGFAGRADTWAVGVSAAWVGFDGGAAAARTRSAAAGLAEARARQAETEQRAEDDLARARDDVAVARLAGTAAEAGLVAAEEALRVAGERLAQGAATPARVAEAERDLADAVVARARATEQLALAYERLRRAVGEPLFGGAP